MYAVQELANRAKVMAAFGLKAEDAVSEAANDTIRVSKLAARKTHTMGETYARLIKVAEDALVEDSDVRNLLVATVRHCKNPDHAFGECNH